MVYKNFAMLAVIFIATLSVSANSTSRVSEMPEVHICSADMTASATLPLIATAEPATTYFVPLHRMENEEYAQLLKTHGWPADSLNTAANASYLSDEEKNIILSMNLIRFDPVRYAHTYVITTIEYYQDKAYHYPGLDFIIITQEGALPVEELFNELLQASPQPLLYPAEGLCRAAASHANFQSRRGELGHDGQGGMRARIEREGTWHRRIGENIAYGNTSAHHAILSLMIDDGVPGRGHRINMLHPEFNVAGVAWATHPRYDGGVYVIKYAGGFTEKQP